MLESRFGRGLGWLIIAALALPACNRDWDATQAGNQPHGPASAVDAPGEKIAHPGALGASGRGRMPAMPGAVGGSRAAFAALPDGGDLIDYPRQRIVRQQGAYTWHQADVSEAHALRSIVDGVLRLTTPDGRQLSFQYERHVEHASGDWTWVGRLLDAPIGRQAILTFGPEAVFGSIGQPADHPLRLAMRDGKAWMVETDADLQASAEARVLRSEKPDFLVPPDVAPAQGRNAVGDMALGAYPSSAEAPPATNNAATASATVVDILVGYTPGFAAAQGSASAAVTRINFLVEVGNEGFSRSQVGARLRLVHAMQVNYSDATANADTLQKLTGYKSGSRITPDPAFNALRAARQTYGADLVTLVRKFSDPENDGCGIAWLIGGGLNPISQGHEYFGYSVVSDGQDQGTDGKTYYCRDETMVHEFGHNMGSAHDVETAKDDDGVLQGDEYGRYPYSFGYRTSRGSGDFYTIMAYGEKRTAAPYQVAYRVFSNPRITFCGGFPCGIENHADNARSLGQTAPLIAQFRPTQVPLDTKGVRLFGVAKAAIPTALHILNGQDKFALPPQFISTALPYVGRDLAWDFDLGDYNADGTPDLYVFKKYGSPTTEVHVLNGARGYGVYLRNSTTALGPTGSDGRWVLKMGDYNRDGTLDLYAIDRVGDGISTQMHVLNGASNYKTFLTHTVTVLGATGRDDSWKFELADMNRDGFPDLYAIRKNGATSTEVNVLSGAHNFKHFLLNKATILPRTGSDNTWDFEVHDFNGDGVPDLYAINKRGASGMTEIAILNGADEFQSYLLNVVSGLPAVSPDRSWEFVVAELR